MTTPPGARSRRCSRRPKPGEPIGRLDEIHRATLDAAGFAKARFSACG
jgi:Xaa-Pro dipeptidase